MINPKYLKRALTSLLIASSLSACALSRSAGPEDANRVMDQATQFRQGGVKALGPTAQTRKPLRVGQWAATLSRSKSNPNEVTLQVMKVADVTGSRVTLETELYAAENGAKRLVLQQTVLNFPVNARTAYSGEDAKEVMRDIKIESIRMMDENGEVTTLPQLPFGMGSAATDLFESTVAISDVRTEACSSQSFRSSKCLLVPFESRVLWMNDSGTTYAHSDVPVLGFIRSDSKKYDIETIGFGDKGAKILIR